MLGCTFCRCQHPDYHRRILISSPEKQAWHSYISAQLPTEHHKQQTTRVKTRPLQITPWSTMKGLLRRYTAPLNHLYGVGASPQQLVPHSWRKRRHWLSNSVEWRSTKPWRKTHRNPGRRRVVCPSSYFWSTMQPHQDVRWSVNSGKKDE